MGKGDFGWWFMVSATVWWFPYCTVISSTVQPAVVLDIQQHFNICSFTYVVITSLVFKWQLRPDNNTSAAHPPPCLCQQISGNAGRSLFMFHLPLMQMEDSTQGSMSLHLQMTSGYLWQDKINLWVNRLSQPVCHICFGEWYRQGAHMQDQISKCQ